MFEDPSIDISVVIPAKDEEKRLPAFLSDLLFYIKNSKKSYEIIVVDDGSSDQTTPAILKFQEKFDRLKVIRLKENRGKGYAIRTGFFEACGEVVAFLDADGSTPPSEIEDQLHYFDEGYDVVIGSRVLTDQRHQVQTLNYRKRIGQIFNFFVHLFLMKDIHDTQCGFKMFRKRVIPSIFSRMNIYGFGFDLEILYLAKKMGYKIKETPVNWHHVDDSKTSLIRDSIRMFNNIFQVRRWHGIPMNTSEPHMSGEEIKLMDEVEDKHWWFQARLKFLKQCIRRESSSYKRILDAGCGTGLNLKALQEFGPSIGCDIQKEAVDLCRQKDLTKVTRCHLDQTSFKEKQFDLVTLFDVLEHVQQPENVLKELRRLLTDEGTCILTVPAFKFLWSPHDEAVSHLRRYGRKELIQTCEDAGFEVKRTQYFFCTPFLPVAMIRIIKRIFLRPEKFQSDTAQLPSPFLNKLLMTVLSWEAKHSFLPFGTTLCVVLNKGKESNQFLYAPISNESGVLKRRSFHNALLSVVCIFMWIKRSIGKGSGAPKGEIVFDNQRDSWRILE